MDDDDEYASIRERIAEARLDEAAGLAELVAPENCADCGKQLGDSYLWEKFSYPVCDGCRFSCFLRIKLFGY
ncbi:unnamed protein product [Gongylonema pulchrum]|uniref:LIM zinc-binding domain-containing protein n=1 Tax=Gongylonema pulchrum TaxID=637853 RepID=A0A183EFM4_9BILA|nr:unnamed protein product [Gongylonema pulchrum]